MTEPTTIRSLFPCHRVPSDPAEAKLIGLYRQVQPGRYLQRVCVPGGRLAAGQWRALAAAARRFTPATPLHLTTRQDVEFHDLRPEEVPALQQSLHRAGLTCLGAAGDTFRNITVCPCAGSAPGTVDLMPLARQIQAELRRIDGIYRLPRKFKISLSCGAACGQPWINDLGLSARRRGGRWGFSVVVAGSLGARPGTGTLLFDWAAPGDVLPITVAVVDVFAEHGDREDRRKARLRHVRERMGADQFGRLLRERIDEARRQRDWPAVRLAQAQDVFGAGRTLTFANGDVRPDAADALADLEADAAYRVRIANHHRVIVFGRTGPALRQALEGLPALAEALRPQPSVTACPGKRWCSRALVHTTALADRIRAELGDILPPEATVCISGCPNGCAHPAVADVGLVGCLAGRDGRKEEAFHLMTGGGMGRDARLAEVVARRLSPDQAIARIGGRIRRQTHAR